jgi:hypothetical protein
MQKRRDPNVQFQSLIRRLARRLHVLASLGAALTAAGFSEGKNVVFAAEGLLLAHASSTAESGFKSVRPNNRINSKD